MKETCKELITFVSTQGQFLFNRMPFGLRNSQAIYQWAIDEALSGSVDDTCISFPDLRDIWFFWRRYSNECAKPELNLGRGRQNWVPTNRILRLYRIFKKIDSLQDDLVFSISVTKEALYAGDCCKYISSSSLDIVNANLHCNVECIMRWSKHNKMVINSEKSYTMLICTRHKLTHLAREQSYIYCGTTQLDDISSQIHQYRGSQSCIIIPNGII